MSDNKTKIWFLFLLLLPIGLLFLFIFLFPEVSSLGDMTNNKEIIERYSEITVSLFSGIGGTIIGYFFSKIQFNS